MPMKSLAVLELSWRSCIYLKIVGDRQLLEEKILSIPDHISNTHVFKNNKLYKRCGHPDLGNGNRDKSWLKKGELVSLSL